MICMFDSIYRLTELKALLDVTYCPLTYCTYCTLFDICQISDKLHLSGHPSIYIFQNINNLNKVLSKYQLLFYKIS